MQGVVLTGGKSSRMGTNKALLPINNKPMISHVVEELNKITSSICVISNEPASYPFIKQPIYKDIHPGSGPLAGLESAMVNSEENWFAVSACDTPNISNGIYQYLASVSCGYDAVIPIYKKKIHPLAGYYNKSCLPIMEESINKGKLRVTDVLDEVRTLYVQDLENHFMHELLELHFENINDSKQYQRVLTRI